VGRPGSGFSGNGRVVLSGEDGELGAYSTKILGYGASGAGGAHGVWHHLQDGAGTPPLVGPSNLIARNGISPRSGVRLPEPRVERRNSSGAWRSFYEAPNSTENRWSSAYRHTIIPESQVPGDSIYDSSLPIDPISLLLQAQRDNQIVIHVTAERGPPSDGDVGDLGIARADVEDVNNLEPFAYILTEDGWEEFDWSSANAVYRLLLANLRVPDGGDRILSSPTRPDSPGDLWHNTNTGTIVRLVEGGPPDELIYEAGGSVGDNRLLDIDYEGFAAGLGGWYVAILKDLMPRYPPRVVLGNAAGGGVGEGTASLNAPTNPSYTRYSATSGALVWNAVPASAVVGGPFRYRVRRDGVSDVILGGRSTSNMTVDSLGPDEIIYQVRLERVSDGAFSEWLEITRPAEAGGSSGGDTGATNLTAPTERNGGFVRYSSTAGALLWNAVSAEDAPGSGYQYRIERVGHSNGPQGVKTGRATNSYGVDSLAPNTVQQWRVRLELADGSEVSAWLTLTGDTTA